VSLNSFNYQKHSWYSVGMIILVDRQLLLTPY